MMRRTRQTWALVVALVVALIQGCQPAQPFHFLTNEDLSHYLDQATQIEYPDTDTTTLADVERALPPLTLDNATPDQYWELSLQDCVTISLGNAKVMRSLGGRLSSISFNPRPQVNDPSDILSTNTQAATTVYTPAITETTPFIGVEAALSAFDPTISSSFNYAQTDHPQNVGGGAFQQFFARALLEDQATFQSSLSKVNASGGTLTVRSGAIYDNSNNPTRQLAKDWTATQELGFSQPLLQGAGVQFNRIAGPSNPFTGVGTFTFDGVMLARINTDISLAEFEKGVRNLVADVESAYWELNFAYRALETAKAGRTAAQQTYIKVHRLYIEGAVGGEAEKEAQAKEQFFQFQTLVLQAFNDLLRAEDRLRFVMGLSVSDGRLIRPADEPTTAKVDFDWAEVHCEALARSVELRQQKFRIKERELELIAARNFLLPRLDLNGTYRFYGLGDKLIDESRGPKLAVTPEQLNQPGFSSLPGTNAVGILTGGQFQEWNLGAQFTMFLGFRKELAQVRHYELQLAKERAILQDSELEVSHQVGDAVRNTVYHYRQSEANFNRRLAAEAQVEAVQAAYDNDKVTFDQVLEAQRRRADAEANYYRSLADYARSIMQVHYRKGSLLEYNGVHLTEGPWPAKAYFDAERLAKQRDASYYLNYGFTRPRVISQGPYIQEAGGDDGTGGRGQTSTDTSHVNESDHVLSAPEPIPAPPSLPATSEPRSTKVPGRGLTGATFFEPVSDDAPAAGRAADRHGKNNRTDANDRSVTATYDRPTRLR